LLELLLATVCLAADSGGVLAALRYTNDKTIISKQRLLALHLACTQMEGAKSAAFNSTLTAGVTTTNPSVTGIPATITMTKTVALVPTTQLYTVSVTVSWVLQSSSGAQTQTVSLDTIVWYGNVT